MQGGTEVFADNLGKRPAGELVSEFRARVGFFDAAPFCFFGCNPSSARVEVRGWRGDYLTEVSGAYPNRVSAFVQGDSFQVAFNPGNSPGGDGAVLDGYDYDRRNGGIKYFPPMRFPGQYYDEETDLHENWNRYYDPALGRYLSPEPLLQDPLEVMLTSLEGQSMPTYAYGYNNPLRYSDPDGLKPGDRFVGKWAQNRAAADAFDFINRRSIREDREYGGLICRELATGKFFASDPKPGKSTMCQPASSPCPDGSVRVAEYHTHGGGYDWSRFFHDYPDMNLFGGPGAFNGYDYDKYSTGKYGDTSYLATQSGHYYKFYSSTGRETRLWP